MYRINKSTNDIEKLDERLFKDLGFRERDHLQEWIAKNPEVLGCYRKTNMSGFRQIRMY